MAWTIDIGHRCLAIIGVVIRYRERANGDASTEVVVEDAAPRRPRALPAA